MHFAKHLSGTGLFATAATLALASLAHADVTISSDATSNMSCSGGVCSPTATDAVLNVTDLENYLASGNVEVTTTGSGVQANNIDVAAAVSWSAASALALDAYQSISFSAVTEVTGAGAVALTTNDGGSNGLLLFRPGGELGFSSLDDLLVINGDTYRLVGSVKELASAVVKKHNGHFAFARNYDAGKDGLYYSSPIPVPFTGDFDGLGHHISNLQVADEIDSDIGLFAQVAKAGALRNFEVTKVDIVGYRQSGFQSFAGAVVGANYGTIINVFSSGSISANFAGGIAGYNTGLVSVDQSAARVRGRYGSGGLVGENYAGTITQSFATGPVAGNDASGGLAGEAIEGGQITNSYALGSVGKHKGIGGFVGGSSSSISTCYSTGLVSGSHKSEVGGFSGDERGTVSNSYWDTTTSGTDQGSGDGNDTGLTGLTTEQLQSGLPSGFDPSIWAEDSTINNGFPYLINNPPPQ